MFGFSGVVQKKTIGNAPHAGTEHSTALDQLILYNVRRSSSNHRWRPWLDTKVGLCFSTRRQPHEKSRTRGSSSRHLNAHGGTILSSRKGRRQGPQIQTVRHEGVYVSTPNLNPTTPDDDAWLCLDHPYAIIYPAEGSLASSLFTANRVPSPHHTLRLFRFLFVCFSRVANCRLCVFNRGLFSQNILEGEEVRQAPPSYLFCARGRCSLSNHTEPLLLHGRLVTRSSREPLRGEHVRPVPSRSCLGYSVSSSSGLCSLALQNSERTNRSSPSAFRPDRSSGCLRRRRFQGLVVAFSSELEKPQACHRSKGTEPPPPAFPPPLPAIPLHFISNPQVPFVDCPCCVPDTYEMGGDIDCDFLYSAPPIAAPLATPSPSEAPAAEVTTAPDATTAPLAAGERAVDIVTLVPSSAPETLAPTIPPVRRLRGSGCYFGVGVGFGADVDVVLDDAEIVIDVHAGDSVVACCCLSLLSWLSLAV